MKAKIIIAVITLLFGIVTVYFHNRHVKEITALEQDSKVQQEIIKAQDIIIKDFYSQIGNNKKITDENINRVKHYDTDSLAWYFSNLPTGLHH